MRQQEKNIFNRLLEEIANKKPDYEKKLTAMFAIKGHKSKNELMIVGQATNSWDIGWTAKQVQNYATRQKIIEESFNISNKQDECPMRWVTDYMRDNYSPFWSVVRLTTSQLQIADIEKEDWQSYLIYSNLCKIGFLEKNGNPPHSFCELQRSLCVELMEEEMRQWSPRRILFLIGNWFDWFFEHGNFVFQDLGNIESSLRAGHLKIPNTKVKSDYVVAPHPRRIPKGMTQQSMASEIASLFEKLRKTKGWQ